MEQLQFPFTAPDAQALSRLRSRRKALQKIRAAVNLSTESGRSLLEGYERSFVELYDSMLGQEYDSLDVQSQIGALAEERNQIAQRLGI